MGKKEDRYDVDVYPAAGRGWRVEDVDAERARQLEEAACASPGTAVVTVKSRG